MSAPPPPLAATAVLRWNAARHQEALHSFLRMNSDLKARLQAAEEGDTDKVTREEMEGAAEAVRREMEGVVRGLEEKLEAERLR